MLPHPTINSGISVVIPTPVFSSPTSPTSISPSPDQHSNFSDPPPPSASSNSTLPQLDPFRIQQLYTLAFADRMRLLHPLTSYNPYPSHLPSLLPPGLPALPGLAPRFGPPPDLAMFPYAKFDPRLFRIPFPDEPKPQHSYIGLISMAILSSADKKLVLADIYQYILDNFPYFRHRGPGWRNSIRHNLSLNDCFIKSGRAANGKGHYWAVHPACVEDFQKGDFRRRRAQRKVRRHMGLNVDEEDSPSPPASPPTFPVFSQSVYKDEKLLAAPTIYKEENMLDGRPESTSDQITTKKRNFDVAFLIGKEDSESCLDGDKDQKLRLCHN